PPARLPPRARAGSEREPRAADTAPRRPARAGLDRRSRLDRADGGRRLRERCRRGPPHRVREPAGRRGGGPGIRRRARRRRGALAAGAGLVCLTPLPRAPGPPTRGAGSSSGPGPTPRGTVAWCPRQSDGLRVQGWALEPDTDGPGFVDVYANGVGVGRFLAGG